jgi:hypothetical protein
MCWIRPRIVAVRGRICGFRSLSASATQIALRPAADPHRSVAHSINRIILLRMVSWAFRVRSHGPVA